MKAEEGTGLEILYPIARRIRCMDYNYRSSSLSPLATKRGHSTLHTMRPERSPNWSVVVTKEGDLAGPAVMEAQAEMAVETAPQEGGLAG